VGLGLNLGLGLGLGPGLGLGLGNYNMYSGKYDANLQLHLPKVWARGE